MAITGDHRGITPLSPLCGGAQALRWLVRLYTAAARRVHGDDGVALIRAVAHGADRGLR